MNVKKDVDEFVARKTLALIGFSRKSASMSHSVRRELVEKGYKIYAVNPAVRQVGDIMVYPDFASIPEKVGGAIFMTPAAKTAEALAAAVDSGVERVWIQQGAESDEAIKYCRDKNLPAVWGRCIMMFAEPVGSYHAFHRFFAKLFGKLPR